MHPPVSNALDALISARERRNSNTKKGMRRPRPGKGVTWAKRCQIKIIPPLSQYSEEEKSSSFCAADDYQRMRDETAELLFLMKHGAKETDDVTYRGLEGKKEGDFRRRKAQRCRVYFAVFQESDKQFDQGVYDPEAIADMCRLLTQSSCIEAVERAAQDAKDIGQTCAPAPSTSSLEQEQGLDDSDTESVCTMVETDFMTKFFQRKGKTNSRTNSSHILASPIISSSSRHEGKRDLVVLASIVAGQ